MENYIVRDGDIILTTDGFIFYAVGYEHPNNKAISYLKYIPKELKHNFSLNFIEHTWFYEKKPYIRPKQLYSPRNFKIILDSFKKYFPDYLFYSKEIQKDIFVVPFHKIQQVFIPQQGLRALMNKEKKDDLQGIALDLIKYLSRESEVALGEFGLHGSLLTGMHSEQSDVDIGIYDQKNYFKVKKTVKNLEKEGKIQYLFEIESDKWRFNKCEYKGKKFVFNAIRKLDHVINSYDLVRYEPKFLVRGEAKISDNSESAYRPAIYQISNFRSLNKKILLEMVPTRVVSMIGEYRDIAQRNQKIEFNGLLEEVTDIKTSSQYYRVFIGSENEGEYMKPI